MPRKPSQSKPISKSKATPGRRLAGAGPSGPALLRAATKEAFNRVNTLLSAYYEQFSPAQQRRIREAVGSEGQPDTAGRAKSPKAPKPAKEALPPRFWLPYSGETWSGRGRPPQAFIAWEGTVAHTEWKKRHPDERFPKYPG